MDERISVTQDDSALFEFFQGKYGLIVHTAQRFAPEPSMVSDIVQQVCLEFLKNTKKKNWDLSKDGKSLLYQITKNIACKHWRSRQRQRPESLRKIGEFLFKLNEEKQENWETQEEELEKRNQIHALRECLEHLTPKNRSLIDMKYFLGYSVQEIAETFHVKQNSIWRAIARIRLQLADCISNTIRKPGR